VVAAVTILPSLSSAVGWRFSLLLSSLLVIALTIIVSLAPNLPSSVESKESPPITPVCVARKMWLLVLINLVVSAATLPFTTFSPGYLCSEGFTPQAAALFLCLIMMQAVLIGPCMGKLIDRSKMYPQLLIVASLLLANSLLFMLVSKVSVALVAVLFAAGSAIVPVAVYPRMREMVEADELGTGLALLMTGSNAGGSIGLAITGSIMDGHGGYHGAFLFLSVVPLAMIPLALPLAYRRSVDSSLPNNNRVGLISR
jgi:predicted MFS family arabinose efflux permease